MARRTTNYGWNISEGSDLVNPLTDIFPNFESLDTDLKGVSDSAIGTATELKTGTVHALTRDDTSRDVFKFTATTNFTAGDTFTVDGEQVSALTTSGEQLTTGCYIIGSEVIVAKKGTLLTFFISNVITDASTLEGHSASYFATASDLSDTDADVLTLSNKVGTAILITEAQDCSGAINELHNEIQGNLIWENPSPDSAYSSGTINVANIQNYDELEFVYTNIAGSSRSLIKSYYKVMPSGSNYHDVYDIFVDSSGTVTGTFRELNVNNSTGDIDIGTGYNRRQGTSQTVNASALIPYKVIGYK